MTITLRSLRATLNAANPRESAPRARVAKARDRLERLRASRVPAPLIDEQAARVERYSAAADLIEANRIRARLLVEDAGAEIAALFGTTPGRFAERLEDRARENLELNGFSGLEHLLIRSDIRAFVASLTPRDQWDLVVVDPPAFIKRRKDHPKGLAAYRRLNQLALQVLDRDGLLLSCSCSYHLGPGELTDAVQRAARHLGRFAQLVAVGAQAPDHPVHPAIDETRYLRAFLFRVTDSC